MTINEGQILAVAGRREVMQGGIAVAAAGDRRVVDDLTLVEGGRR